ncbi:MAG: DNRLRE domain-containing protein, partial [Robinsoniella sp.]|nr:DNRLRE domain-containing protein [Robinsoniella sp.]
MNKQKNQKTEGIILQEENQEGEEEIMKETTKEIRMFDDVYDTEHVKETMACVEVVEKRTACQKVFENADHSFTAAVYPKAVHYFEDGVWKEIDNTLEEEEEFEESENTKSFKSNSENSEKKETAQMDVQREGGWKKKSGNVKVTLFHHAKENKTIRIQKENAMVEWGLKGASKVKGMLEESKEAGENDDPMTLRRFTNAVRYGEVLPGVDFQCLLVGDEVKDNLILKSKDTPHTFTFCYRVKKLHPVMQSRKIVFLNEKEETVFCVDAPFMRDAKGALSQALTLALQQGKNEEEWEMTVHADEGWLKEESRAYPIVIDPTTSSPVSFEQVHANVVSAVEPTVIDGQNAYLVLDGGSNVRRAFLKFQLPQLNPGDMVINAQMMVVSFKNDPLQEEITLLRRLELHRVLQDWEPSNTCWNNKPIYEEQILDTYQYIEDDPKFLTFGITDLVKDWYENGKNYGVMLKKAHETEERNLWLLGAGTHEGISELRPQILVTYVSYSGLEGYWTYHSQSVGRAGTVHINDYNGNLVYVHPVLSMSGNRMPVNVNLVYNNTEYQKTIGYGLGFRLNYHQTIEKVKIGTTDYYRHIDGDGTAHYFYEDKKKNVWKDESNTELTLEFGTTDDDAFRIKDKENGRLIFHKAGYLVQIKDRNENALKITWTDNKITKLEDGAGRVTTLAYNADGLLASVTDPVNRVKSFAYDAKKQLTTITDVDGEVMNLSYATIAGLLNGVKNVDDYQVKYAYTGGNPRRIRRVCEYAGTERGNALNMVYGNNKTKFTDDRGKMECYFFNNSGNTVSVQDDKGYAMAWKFNQDGNHVNQLDNQTKMQLATAQLLQDPCGKTGIGTIWKGSSNAGTVTVSANTDAAQTKTGDRCLKIASTASTGVGRCYQTVSIPAGRSFTFSAYVKMDVEELGSVGGCYLSLYYTDKDGKQQTANNKRIETTGGTWKLLSLPFTLPSDASSQTVTCNVVLRNLKGTVYLDDLQVEWGLNPNRHNFISNGDLTYDHLDLFTREDSDDGDKIVTTGTETELPVTGLAKVGKAMATVYTGPGTTYEKLIDVWKDNPLEIINWVNGKDGAIWYRVRTQWEDTSDEKNTGYIHADDIEFFLAGGNGVRMGTLAFDNITVYVGAGSEYAVEATPSKDTQMVIKDTALDPSGNEWHHVRFQYGTEWYGGYVPANKVADNCTNAASVKAAAQTNAYYYPDTNYGIVRIIEEGETVPIRGTYIDETGSTWYLIPSFLSNQNATMGYARADAFTVVTEPSFALTNTEMIASGNGNLNGRVYKIVGDPFRDKKLTQTLEISGKKGDCYLVNAWGKGRTVPLTRTYRKFGVEVVFVGPEGADGSAGAREVHTSNFGADTREWQSLCDAVVAKADYEKIEVSYVYCHNANIAYFDGLSLYREQYGASYTYDDKGNVISVTDADGKSRKFEYNDNDDLISMTDVRGKNFKYTYDSKHNITKATSAANRIYHFAYDTYGNITEQKTADASDSTSYMKISKTYTTDGNYPLKATDALGNVTNYEWMTQRGVLNSMTNAKGSQTFYRYDN